MGDRRGARPWRSVSNSSAVNSPRGIGNTGSPRRPASPVPGGGGAAARRPDGRPPASGRTSPAAGPVNGADDMAGLLPPVSDAQPWQGLCHRPAKASGGPRGRHLIGDAALTGVTRRRETPVAKRRSVVDLENVVISRRCPSVGTPPRGPSDT